MKNFNEMELDPQILRGVNMAGFTKPFPIQERAILTLLTGLDVIGQAKTGTGKTAAFGLPLLQMIDTQNNHVQALVLSPTRELAQQVSSEIGKLGKYTGIKIMTIYGGQPINIQFQGLQRGAHAIVGTPGRIIDHIKRGTLNLGSVKFVVLDEADTMLDMGFVDDIDFILDTIPDVRQLSLFSATMPKLIIDLSKKYMQNPERILIDSDEPSVEELEQYYTVVNQEDKQPFLVQLLSTIKTVSTIIFCRTKFRTRKLSRYLENCRFNVVSLHGDLTQSQRDHNMRLFRSGNIDILVATDVASRGIDIRHVDCIINYDVPQNPLLYFHRVGRTARAGDSGKAYTFISNEEFGDFARIQNLTKVKIKPLRPGDDKYTFRVPNNDFSNERRARSRSKNNYFRYKYESKIRYR